MQNGCTTKHNHFNKSISQFLNLKIHQAHLFPTQNYLFYKNYEKHMSFSYATARLCLISK